MKARSKPITLKELAGILDLSPATISRIVNGHGAKYRIAGDTQKRVLEAAAQHGYSANAVARSLRQNRSYTIGVILPEISDGYSTAVVSGIEDELLNNGFFYFVVSHRHRADLLKEYPRLLLTRAVEGIIAVDTHIEQEVPVPVVAVSGHKRREGVINIELDHKEAARLGLSHLVSLGHKQIAYIKGQAFSSDTRYRWEAIVEAARAMNLPIHPKLVVQLDNPQPGSMPGAEITRELLKTGIPFTALFAFNDVTAIGAILTLREAGLRVPRDVSVLGFDDVSVAAINHPPITTIHQPLRAMGQAAASTLLGLIRDEIPHPRPTSIKVHPRLVVRKSTAHAAQEAAHD